ncbi:MAG: divalent-cation tolerance protein CutA [Thermoanaerobaculia bacterium]
MKSPPASLLVVVTTVGTEQQALDIAHDLVGKHLAACVNIVPRIRSVFFWKGKVNDDTEWMLFIKTASENFDTVRDAIKRLNVYELPEILGFSTAHADDLFVRWVVDASTSRRPSAPRKKKSAKKTAR